ncbi:hypothetical protein [Marinobacterium marinum]|uniref:RepB-like DNA primase domain-containing protein n=1 Tax=Marinobacterium marinum TaxID=2756129 RepID=A0A7W1WX58_9GAMM|nr:hypothetical protein [Marinobacterium marinum]MBA4501842.1 hypothetical protein [Marinobacterium marinum]
MNAPQAISPANNVLTVPLCAGRGQYHTEKREQLDTITLQQIRQMIEAGRDGLQTSDKHAGLWFIPSDQLTRSHEQHRNQGRYHALWFDADELQGRTMTDSIEHAAGHIPGDFWAYASRSATKDNQKHRLIIPLLEPVDGYTWQIMQAILNDLMQTGGIQPDIVNERSGQLCYLPNPGEWYSFHVEEMLGFLSPHQWADQIAAIRAADAAAKAEADTKREESRRKAAELVKVQGVLPRTAYAEQVRSGDAWISYGAKPRGKRLLSPYSSSGSAAISIMDSGKWVSHHGSDQAAGIGAPFPGGSGQWGDSFDLYCHFEHGGDEAAAVEAVAVMLDKDGNQERRKEWAIQREQEHAARTFEDLQDSTAEPEQDTSPASDPGIDLDYPPGIAGDICQLMQMKARRDRPELYKLAALHVLALLSNGRESEYTKKLNLLTLGIASSAAGKENPQEVAKELLHSVHLSSKVTSEPGSFRDMIYNMIETDGASLYIVDEAHSLLGGIQDKNAASYEKKIKPEILKMTTTNRYTFRPMEKRGPLKTLNDDLKQVNAKLDKQNEDGSEISDDLIRLTRTKEKLERHIDYIENGWPNPFCSIMGHSVPEHMDKLAADSTAIAEGLMGRTLVVRCPEGGELLKRGKRDQNAAKHLEAEIVERLSRIKRSREMVIPSPDAAEYLEQCIDFYDAEEQRNCQYLGAIYRRAPEQLYKVASLLAVETGTITLKHAKYAGALVKSSIADIRELIIQAMAQGDAAADGAVIENARLKLLKQCKGQGLTPSATEKTVTRSREWQAMQNKDVTRDRLAELLDRMQASGELELIDNGRSKRYRSKSAI